jgi:hypothetical protein
MARHVPDVDRRVVASVAFDYFVVQVAPHVAVVFGLEQRGVAAHRALSYIGIVGDLVLLKSMLFVVVDVFECAEAVFAHVTRAV